MQFLKIKPTTKLSDLSNRIGSRNVDAVLHANQLTRSPNLGEQFTQKCNNIISNSPEISWQRKVSVLNTMTTDSDVFETAAIMGSTGWKLLSNTGTFPNYLLIPDTIELTPAADTLGNKEYVYDLHYKRVLLALQEYPHSVDPSIFNEYSSIKASQLIDAVATESYSNSFSDFNLPWNDVVLYSSLTGDYIQFPCYPEQVSDGVTANYTEMPDLLYQYEPWKLYNNSGPRSNTYSFDIHRDMWGDHRQGGANKLIRYCMANCYPSYTGSLVNPPTVSLYVHGNCLIHGIMEDVKVDWDGPIGQDGWYLHFKLSLTITEISQEVLNFETVKRKPLIG